MQVKLMCTVGLMEVWKESCTLFIYITYHGSVCPVIIIHVKFSSWRSAARESFRESCLSFRSKLANRIALLLILIMVIYHLSFIYLC